MSLTLGAHVQLMAWQQELIDHFMDRWGSGQGSGIAVVATGLGKTVAGLGTAAAVAREVPDLKLAVVVPGVELARQWIASACRFLDVQPRRVGLVGGGSSATFDDHDVIVFVLDSARRVGGDRSALAASCEGHDVFLIVDECHAAGAPCARRIFDAPAVARLGLTATARRRTDDALDEQGQVLPVAKQAHAVALGGVFFRLGFRKARVRGLLPDFHVTHSALQPTEAEEQELGRVQGTIRGLHKTLKDLGARPKEYRRLKRMAGPVGEAARELEQAYFRRKHVLYRCSERERLVVKLIGDALRSPRPPRQIAVFHEHTGHEAGKAGAETLHRALLDALGRGELPLGADEVVLEHSARSGADRKAAVRSFQDGTARVLVSARALQQGIDLPALDLLITAASSSSPLQRIQACGRGLRVNRGPRGLRVFDGRVKQIHHFYIGGTTDCRIYQDLGWTHEFGSENVSWLSWPLGAQQPTRLDGPDMGEGRRDAEPHGSPEAPVADAADDASAILQALAVLAPRHAQGWRTALSAGVRPHRSTPPRQLTYPEAIIEGLLAQAAGEQLRARALAAELGRRAARRAPGQRARRLEALAGLLDEGAR